MGLRATSGDGDEDEEGGQGCGRGASLSPSLPLSLPPSLISFPLLLLPPSPPHALALSPLAPPPRSHSPFPCSTPSLLHATHTLTHRSPEAAALQQHHGGGRSCSTGSSGRAAATAPAPKRWRGLAPLLAAFGALGSHSYVLRACSRPWLRSRTSFTLGARVPPLARDPGCPNCPVIILALTRPGSTPQPYAMVTATRWTPFPSLHPLSELTHARPGCTPQPNA